MSLQVIQQMRLIKLRSKLLDLAARWDASKLARAEACARELRELVARELP